jgi:hypothetical protein
MLVVRCKCCNTEIVSTPKIQVCGCPNKLQVRGDKITAVDLSQVVVVELDKENKKSSFLSPQDLAYQEARRQRKVRKLDFEVR